MTIISKHKFFETLYEDFLSWQLSAFDIHNRELIPSFLIVIYDPRPVLNKTKEDVSN